MIKRSRRLVGPEWRGNNNTSHHWGKQVHITRKEEASWLHRSASWYISAFSGRWRRPRRCIATAPADARTTKVTITKETPTFGGYSWPGVGQYEKLIGTAEGELDPNDPHNAVITDIELAPRNAAGRVVYSHNFYILKPINLATGNHKIVYDAVNRGSKTFSVLNRGLNGDDPGSVTDPQALANTFLFPKGYTYVASGWDASAGTDPSNFNLIINLPVAKNLDGSEITGPGYEYIVTGGASAPLTYAAANLDKTQAKLTRRVHLDDVPQVVPSTGWNYNAGGTAISLVGRQLRQQRHLRILVHGEEPDGQRHRLCRDPRFHDLAQVRGEGRLHHRQSARGRRDPDLHHHPFAAGAHAQRLPHARLQCIGRQPEGVRRHLQLGRCRARAST